MQNVGLDRRTRWLMLAGALGVSGQSLAGSAGALLAARLGHGSAAAGLPQALTVVGAAAATLVISRMTLRRGRGRALAAGCLGGAGGAAVVVAGASAGSLLCILLGSVLVGAGQAAVMLGRYAAAELAAAVDRARAMGRMLSVTTVGAVAGPNLLAPTDALGRDAGLPPLAGPFAYTVVTALLAAAVLRLGVGRLRPNAMQRTASAPWTAGGLAGLTVLGVANLVMVGVMTMAPVHLREFGTGLGPIGLVISLHIAGMFVPSVLSGWATDRFGPPRVAGLAALLLVGACSWAATAGSTAAMIGAMALLGVGWNVALLSGSALLTADVPDAVRPVREGWGDVGMGVAAGGGGAASGVVMSASGYPVLGLVGAMFAAVLLPVALSVRRRSIPVPQQPEDRSRTTRHAA